MATETKAIDPAKIKRAAETLKMASDPTRLAVLMTLADGPGLVGAMAEALGVAQPGLSHHVRLLHVGGLVERGRAGKTTPYMLTDRGRALAGLASRLSA